MKNLRVVENGLVPVYEDGEARRVINAREMHEFLESKQDFTDWIKNRIEKYGFLEGEDYSIILGNRAGTGIGKPRTEYILFIGSGPGRDVNWLQRISHRGGGSLLHQRYKPRPRHPLPQRHKARPRRCPHLWISYNV